ncbi:hypothetical protein H634G_11235 [Metarhizium anisopliae BRIP 53293]|uniref:Asl1-like glycosyl hydrolase catalytic domain-containing protein n=1 Tax=Metarhizium anisopliae BRIP 53293 TaxID=1291518 RepID=A0A0D9NHP9_METAN|nr:hypothetical protein H634G_11235 [Metarhizium anisopliae BRIP 53293]
MNLIFYLCCLSKLILARECSCSSPLRTQSPVISTSAAVGKRGLAYNEAYLANNFLKQDLKCSWAYNWDSADNGLAKGVEFVPMLWGQKTVPQFQKNINYDSLRENKYKYILGFNEPDHPSQANMPVEEAVDAHIVYLDKYANVTLLSSPAVTSDEGGGPQDRGLDWLRKFLDLCDRRGCKVDFCAVHWYGNTTQADNLFSFLRDAHSTCHGKPIWLTEFNAKGSSAEVSSFLRKVLPVLDGLDFIQRYAWFMATTGNLLESPDTLSEYGRVYATL